MRKQKHPPITILEEAIPLLNSLEEGKKDLDKSVGGYEPLRGFSNAIATNPSLNLPVIVEVEDVEIANQLAMSNEFRQPEYCKFKHKYIFIRRVK